MTEDHAIIIGIQHYPGLNGNGQPALSGVEADALEFEKWILSPQGGDVPEGSVDKILSSQFPSAQEPFDCKPAFTEVRRIFDILRRRSLEKVASRKGPNIGRRLYIFMSGHGISPTPFGQITREVGLLMGNVDDVNMLDNQSHVPGCFMAEWFCLNGCFQEVFLFMDCCRDVMTLAQPNIVFNSFGQQQDAKRLYAYAAQWGRKAKEREIDGKIQGIFTKTLLLGLNGAAADPDPHDPAKGIISAASLKTFLINNAKEFLDKTALNPGDRDEPEVDIYPNGDNGTNIIIKEVPLQKFPVILDFTNPFNGQAEVRTGTFLTVEQLQITKATSGLKLMLPRGVFSLEGIDNGKIVRTEAFEVKGIEKAGSEAKYNLQFN